MKRALKAAAAMLAAAVIVNWSTDAGRAQDVGALVLRGGTLVDGTGKAPVQNSVIVIQGNRIAAVGSDGSVQVPAGVRIIDTTGKTVLPGLIDSHGHYREFLPEMLITYGVTTFMDTGNYMDYILAVRDATAAGKLWGPRIFTTGSGITGPHGGFNRDRVVVKTVDEARAAAREHVRRGVDFIKVYEGITADLLKGVTEEAHKGGIKVIGHLRMTSAREAVEAGIDGLVHAGGVSASLVGPEDEKTLKEASGNRWGTPGGIVMHEAMDETKMDDLAKYLVSKNVAIDPTIVYGAKGVMPGWDRIELECRRMLDDPNLIYVPTEVSASWCTTNHLRNSTPEDLKRRRIGYDKMTKFLKKFADAGGVIVAGSDFVGSAIPGLTTHNEIATYVQDIGLTPMQAIQTATRNTADFYVKGKGIGTVEPGKLADVIVVRGNPLQDIRDTRNVEVVIKDGRVMERGYHASYTNSYKRPFPARETPDSAITSVKPYVVSQGDRRAITLIGSGFTRATMVWAGDRPLATTFVSPTEISVTLCEECVQVVGPIALRVSQSRSGQKSAPAEVLVTHRLTKESS
jgi:imidazolonepropionase-like amidohydrolase